MSESSTETAHRYPARVRTSTFRAQGYHIFGIENDCSIFLNPKERSDAELSKSWRLQRIIRAPGALFEASRKQKIDGLIAQQTTEFVPWNGKETNDIRLFKSTFVN